jgi:hypothetical protein
MGTVISAAIGILSFAIIAFAGKPFGATIFGAVMFAMSYAAFVWNPEKTKQSEVPSTSPSRHETSSEEKVTDMTQKLTAREQAVVNAFAIPLTELGLDEQTALSSAKKIVAEVVSDLQTYGVDPFKSTQGNDYVARSDFTAPRIAAGLRLEDIRQHWNRPLVIVMGEVKLREMMNFVFIDIARMQGRDLVEAGREYKSNFPRYGDPRKFNPSEKFNHGLRPIDADIFPEFAGRVESWRARIGEAEVAKAVKVYGTLNAAVRNLASNGEL